MIFYSIWYRPLIEYDPPFVFGDEETVFSVGGILAGAFSIYGVSCMNRDGIIEKLERMF